MLRIFFESKALTSISYLAISLWSVKCRCTFFISMARQPKQTAKTGAETAQIFTTRVKADKEKYKAYKDKDKERKRASRKSKSNTPSPSEAARKKRLNRERVTKCRT